MLPRLRHKHLHRLVHRGTERQQQTQQQRIYTVYILSLIHISEYSFVTQVDGRGVYSFCMCPGGFVVPAASGPQQIVVNGMSPSNRGSRWSNSGMVVELRPEDLENKELRMMNEEPAFNSQLNMMYFQEALERLCWQQGNICLLYTSRCV